MSCPLLKSFEMLPAPQLHTLAHGFISNDEMRSIPVARGKMPGTVEYPGLAERVYYALGHKLYLQRDFNEMTRLQMKHELQEAGLLVGREDEVMDEWSLRLWVARAARS